MKNKIKDPNSFPWAEIAIVTVGLILFFLLQQTWH